MSIYRNFVLNAPLIPWRVRNALDIWTEGTCRRRWPAVYEFLHFGRLRCPVRAVTNGPKHHFFGYYDKSPWNSTENLLLTHEVDFNDRPPTPADRATVGVVDLSDGNRFVPIAETHAWNWQQGAMLQWHPGSADSQVVYNDRTEDGFVGIVRDVAGTLLRSYERPIYALTPDGDLALSLNFARLHQHRPGYGYAGGHDPWADERHPEDDGIVAMSMETGQGALIVSLAQLAEYQPRAEMEDAHHWVNHIQVSPNGERFAFFHLWARKPKGWGVRLYSANMDGSDLRLIVDEDIVSHYDWLDQRRIMVWVRPAGQPGAFWLCDVESGHNETIGTGVLTEDGHCSFSPDGKWVLNDTYPDRHDMRTLMLYDWHEGRRIDIARLYSPKDKWWGEIRCDLHPRWNRNGQKICVDSVHSGERQLYVMDLKGQIP